MPSRKLKKARKKDILRVAKLFRGARRRGDVSQAEMAALLGRSQSWVSKVEQGQHIPNIFEWYELCQFFRITADVALNGVSRKKFRHLISHETLFGKKHENDSSS